MEVAKPLISRQDALTRYPIGRIVRCCAYRASGLVLWHKTDKPTPLLNVRYRVNRGKHLLAASISGFDPERTSGPINLRRFSLAAGSQGVRLHAS